MEEDFKKLEAECLVHEARVKAELEAALKKAREQEAAQAQMKFRSRLKFWETLKKTVEEEMKELNKSEKRADLNLFDLEGVKGSLALDREQLSHAQRELSTFALEGEAPDRVTRLETDVTPGVEGQKRLKYSGMAGIAILVVGLGVVLLREVRNPRAVTGKDLSVELGLPLFGAIPALPTPRPGEGLDQGQGPAPFQAALTEAVNTARTLLKHANGLGEPPRVLLVASALSGEGKTSLACLLAASLARSGSRTLLIDGDLRRPSIHRMTGVPISPGLADVLTERAETAAAIHPTHVPGLSVMSAGRWSDRVVPVLASTRWSELVAKFRTEFEYVVVDSSPILPVADALELARGVEGVLISALRDVTEVSAMKEAVQQLAGVHARVIGLVMHGERPASYYRSRYAYQYQTAVAEAAEPEARAPTAAP
jgi:capsular exopolysaccharide synthesis family protein